MPRRDEEFWKTAEDWSQRKHLILEYYLTPAAAKLRQVSPDNRVVVLDGFAGRGQYENGTSGSPILMGRLAELCQSWSKPVDLRVYNIEPDRESLRELEACTAPWVQQGMIQNLPGTFRELLPRVLKEAARSPLFAFLDPFRPKHLLFDDFAPLLARAAVTELCVVFHTPAVVRMLQAVRPDARSREAIRQALCGRLVEIFGSRRWEGILSLPASDPDAVVECFAAELVARGARGQAYVGSHAIQSRYEVGLKYHIVYFTRNLHGVRLMNDAFCKEARQVYQQSGHSGQLALFRDDAGPPVEMQRPERLSVLRESLIAIGRAAPSRRWKREDLLFGSILRHFGDFTQSEHLQALKDLMARKTGPRFQPLDGKPAKSRGWITNDHTILMFSD